MLNDTNEEDEEYKQEAYTYVTFLLTKHIQEKIGKKIPKGNVYRKIPKKKTFTIGEKIEGKDVVQELRETQIRSDKTLRIMNEIVANCDYLREMNKNQIHNEWTNDQMQEEREENKNSKKRERERVMNATIAQIHEVGKYTQEIMIPRNAQELIEFIDGANYEEMITEWMEEVRKIARITGIEVAQKMKYMRQTMYATDQKKTIALLTKDQTPQCEIDHEEIRQFFNDRWKKG
jgi:hypothetical protein